MACSNTKQMNNNKDLAKQYYEILDNGNADALDRLLATNLIDHDGHSENPIEEIKGLTLALKHGFTNQHHKLEEVLMVESDKIFVRWRMTGTHTGEFFGNPASGKSVNFVGHDLLQIEDGKITQIWHVENLLGMVEQMNAE